MKKTWLFTVFICLLIIAGGGAVVLWPRTIPFDKCSESYKIYANNPSVEASFIKDFRINDTLTVNITQLKAKDSAGWAQLMYDYEIPDLPPSFIQRINNDEDIVFLKAIFNNDNEQGTSTNNEFNAVMAISFLHNKITIFHITTDDELSALTKYNYPSISVNP